MAYTNDSMTKSVDWITIVIYIALVVLGWVSICGASYDYSDVDFFSLDFETSNLHRDVIADAPQTDSIHNLKVSIIIFPLQ